MERGKFIVFEGGDGSGKTTQVELLRKRLLQIGEGLPGRTFFTRECSDGPIGKLLRHTYLTGDRKCDERVINFLYAADRLDHITNEEDGMLKFIEMGYTVVCDRYFYSSLSYDTYAYVDDKKKYLEALHDIWMRNKLNMELLSPDVVIYLDVPPEVTLSRCDNRELNNSVYETEDKIRKIYRSYQIVNERCINERGDQIITVDGVGIPEEVSDRVWAVLKPFFIS